MPSMHHVAFACRDLEETHRFYHDLLGLPLINTEVHAGPDGSWMKHVFYQLDDGSCLAFFKLHQMGEPEPLRTAVSTDLGLPAWVNHVALRVSEARAKEIAHRLRAAEVPKTMDVDHGWCHSRYFTDPNGILVELCADTTGIVRDEEGALSRMRAVPTA